MKTAIRKHMRDFAAILALFVIAAGVAAYILGNQRLRFPFVEAKPAHVNLELSSAQAVQAGQGQTVRVAGVRIGDIGDVRLRNGVVVVRLDIEPKFRHLIRRDATALLRSKTGLKDMFVEVDPGTGPPLPENGTIQASNTAPDVNPDEILSALDTDTRDYLQLLISGGGGGLRGRGKDLREVFRRLGPTHRDLARVSAAVASRRANLRRLVHTWGLLTDELGRNGSDLTGLVRSANNVLGAMASEDTSLSAAVARLPGALRETQHTLQSVRTWAPVLGSTLQSLRPTVRELPATNAQVIPLARKGTPILRNEIRPFVRRLRPFLRQVHPAARDLSRAAPDLTTAFLKLNRFFDIAAYNPNGAESLDGRSPDQQRARQEGFLYWLAWTAQAGNSVFSTSDANGPTRRITLGGLNCGTLGLVGVPTVLTNALGTAGVCTS